MITAPALPLLCPCTASHIPLSSCSCITNAPVLLLLHPYVTDPEIQSKIAPCLCRQHQPALLRSYLRCCLQEPAYSKPFLLNHTDRLWFCSSSCLTPTSRRLNASSSCTATTCMLCAKSHNAASISDNQMHCTMRMRAFASALADLTMQSCYMLRHWIKQAVTESMLMVIVTLHHLNCCPTLPCHT